MPVSKSAAIQAAPPPALPPALPEVAGFVEVAASDRLLGWAWSPRDPALRVAVELRLGGEVVASAVADRLREDLASNGIGDGRHAFELAVPESCRPRAAELRLFARAGEGEAVALSAPPAADGLAEQMGRVLRGLELLTGSQRLLHRNLQAALTSRQPDGETAPALARLAEALAAATDQIAAVERFVVRLDERLAELGQGHAGVARALPRAALWALAVSATALLVSVAGLVRSLGG
jgi:hypothetical protein